MEFGPDSAPADKRLAIVRGRDKLQKCLGTRFLPIFTPPWNRLDAETVAILKEEGFLGISRHEGEKLRSVEGLPDIPVNVDLHTRREPKAEAGWSAFLNELDTALTAGRAGLMIHHQRMNAMAFEFLDKLLPLLKNHASLELVHFGMILGEN
jgi:peptidoglycan/xylan/chitin deacetylase (PgdA/CDA1 family)